MYSGTIINEYKEQSVQFPLKMTFKIIALANQISVTDHTGQELMYVKQKMFKLKEKIEIFRDSSKGELIYTISADRVLDFSPEYKLTDGTGGELGTLKRHGGRSLWKADYDLSMNGRAVAHIKELNPWAKVGDGLFSEIPLLGFFAGYLFHPRYTIENMQGEQIGVIAKQPAFLEGKYSLEDTGLSRLEDNQLLPSVALLMMVVLMERTRG